MWLMAMQRSGACPCRFWAPTPLSRALALSSIHAACWLPHLPTPARNPLINPCWPRFQSPPAAPPEARQLFHRHALAADVLL